MIGTGIPTIAPMIPPIIAPQPARREPPYFLAIFFRNLLALQIADGGLRYRDAVQAYADSAWDVVRDQTTGLFRFSASRPVQLLEQAAMVQIYADLAEADATARN